MKNRFLEVMGGRARTSAQNAGRSVSVSTSTSETVLPEMIVEMNLSSNNNAPSDLQGVNSDTRL